MKNRWIEIVCIGLALITLAIVAPGCDGSGSPGTVPMVDLKRVAPNNLDLAGRTEAELATPADGAVVINSGLCIAVPPGAVSKDTPVTVKLCTEYPEISTPTVADAPEVQVISGLYDIGPDNTSFNVPVEITIPYDDTSIPAGAKESDIRLVFYDGQNWMAINGQLDTVNNKVSFKTKNFPGFGIAAIIPTLPVTPAGWVILGGLTVVAVAGWYYGGPNIASQAIKDPVWNNNANSYITPYNSVVKQYANMAVISLNDGKNTKIPLKDLADPAKLAQFIQTGSGSVIYLEGKAYANPTYLTNNNWFDWQMPEDYLKNGMVGDCKNVANAMASIFTNLGYSCKCVDGLRNGKRHAWAEVIIDGKPYYVGDAMDIAPLEVAEKQMKLTHETLVDCSNQMWDGKGQQQYKKNWWSKLTISIDSSLAFPGGEIGIDITAAAGNSLEVDVVLEDAKKVKYPYSGATDATTGVFSMSYTLAENAPTGLYTVIATNKISGISEVEIVNVDVLYLSATPANQMVMPGDDFNINARLNYPVETDIVVDKVDYTWPTDKDGFAVIDLNARPTTPLGTYTLTIRAPEFNLSTQVKYTVTTPPSMKVGISTKEVAPGGTVNVNITVTPPQVTKITVRGYLGPWSTNAEGIVAIKLSVPANAQPGKYTVTVEAPSLKLIQSDTYTVTTTGGPVITLQDVTAMAAALTINAEGEDEDSYFEMRLTLGGQFVRTSGVKGYEIIGSDTVDVGEMYYDFTLDKGLTTVTSGVISLLADTGEYFEVKFSNVPMDPDYENTYFKDTGVNALIFRVKGTAVSSQVSSVEVNEPSLGTFNRFFAKDDSELIIILAAATESQLKELLGE